MDLKRSSNRFVDLFNRGLGLSAVLVMWSLIVIFFGYIFYQGASSIFQYGLRSLFLSTEFQLTQGKVSFWAPFGVTLFLAVVTIFLTIPIALRCSIWICFYCKEKYRKVVSTLLLILANIPSVILGMYIRRYLAPFMYRVLYLETSLNLLIAAIALVCMILPLIIVLFNSVLETKRGEIISGELLGLDRNYAIHKIIVPKIKHTIVIAITFIVGRALSESIMLSMLLSSENYQQGYGSGFGGFINSQLNSIAPLIGENYFSDGSTEKIQNLMFLFGGLLLLTSIIINSLFLEWMKRDKVRVNRSSGLSSWDRFKGKVSWSFYKTICGMCEGWEKGKYTTAEFIYGSEIKRIRGWLRIVRRTLEYLCLFIFFVYAFSFLGTTIYGGIKSIFFSGYRETINGYDTLERAIANTFLIVFLSILASIPIALFCSLYLSEYSRNGRFKKYTLALINAASATPSIIFGIFGLFVFIQKLGWTSSGTQGKSILAGILTMILFILPYLTNLFYTNLSDIAYSYREASYILGISKSKTFWSILVPIAINNLIFSVLLTVGKIIGETAPLFLTAGINSSPGTYFMYQGQTLTTRIYAQLFESNLAKGEKIINETIFYCLLFIGFVVVLGKYANKILKWEWWKEKINRMTLMFG